MSMANRVVVAFSAATRSAIRSTTTRRVSKNNLPWASFTPPSSLSSQQCISSSRFHSGSPQRKFQQRHWQRKSQQALASTEFSDDYLDDGLDVDDDDDSDLSNYRPSFSMPPNSQDDSSTVVSTVSTVGKGGVVDTQKDSFLQWSSLGLWTELVTAVTEDLELQAPTTVQRMAVPALLREPPQHTAFLAATGSGKTLAYLLPLLQQLKNQEVFGNNSTATSITASDATQLLQMQSQQQQSQQRPKLIILAPTRELVQQITKVVKQLCHSLKLSSQGLTGGSSLGQERQRLQRHLDVVVATPGRLLQHWKAQNIFLGQIQHVVLDEMDTMLEQGFQGEIRELLYPLLYQSNENTDNAAVSKQQHSEQLKLKPNAPRLVLTSATMTQAVQKLLGINMKDQEQQVGAKKHYVKDPTQPKPTIVLPQPMQVIKAPGLHKAVPRLEQIFINVNNVDKLSLLVDIVSRSHDPKRRMKKDSDDKEGEPYLTLVFCNTVASCRAAQFALSEAGIESLNYHGELNSDMRSDNLKLFSQGQCRVLVATDLAARGLDVPQIQHVVMFDFPLNPLDYLHRTGRTARGNRTGGKVTALVAKRDQVLAKAIEQAVLRGLPLDGLTSRKSDYNQAGGRLLVLKSSTTTGATSAGPRRTGTTFQKTNDPTARLRASVRGVRGSKSGTTSSRPGRSKSASPSSSSSYKAGRKGSATASNERDGVARKRSKSR